MAIERTAQNLATFCLSVVGTAYWMGTYGQRASRQLYNEKKAQYPQYYPPKSWTESSFTDDFNKPVCDCAGLVKWFLWSDNMTNKNPTYKSSEDWGSDTLYKKCTKTGKIGTIPSSKIGLLVFKVKNGIRHHVGVVVDNSGTVVEAKGHAYGVVKSKTSSWDEWGKCNLIKYEDAPTPEPTKDTYTVVTQYQPLTVRKLPTSKSEDVGSVAKGASFKSTVVVEGEDIKGCKAWVGYEDGYVSGYYLSPTPVIPEPVQTTDYRVTTHGDTLKLRKEPTTKSDVLAEMKNGTAVPVSEIVKGESIYGNDDWAKTVYDGKDGYASCKYLVKVENTSSLTEPEKPATTALRTYTVKKGDCLWAISQKFLGQGSRYREIKSLNGLKSDTIYAGQTLKIPNK